MINQKSYVIDAINLAILQKIAHHLKIHLKIKDLNVTIVMNMVTIKKIVQNQFKLLALFAKKKVTFQKNVQNSNQQINNHNKNPKKLVTNVDKLVTLLEIVYRNKLKRRLNAINVDKMVTMLKIAPKMIMKLAIFAAKQDINILIVHLINVLNVGKLGIC